MIALVAEDPAGIHAFAIGSIIHPPPVFNPGGLACVIDGFVVAPEARWETAGKALLAEIRGRAGTRGAVVTVVVCGHLDEPICRIDAYNQYRANNDKWLCPYPDVRMGRERRAGCSPPLLAELSAVSLRRYREISRGGQTVRTDTTGRVPSLFQNSGVSG